MSDDDELTPNERGYLDAYLRQEADERPAPGAWDALEVRLERGRSRRRRIRATVLVALAAAVLVAWAVRDVGGSAEHRPAAAVPLQQAPRVHEGRGHRAVALKLAPPSLRPHLPRVRRAPAAPEPNVAVPDPPRRKRRLPPKPPAAQPDLDPAEVAMLRRARGAANRGEVDMALAVLDRHAREFPRSVLAAKREADRLTVLCQADRATPTDRHRFDATTPDAALRAQVRTACRPSTR